MSSKEINFRQQLIRLGLVMILLIMGLGLIHITQLNAQNQTKKELPFL